jgi:hypothetical protein
VILSGGRLMSSAPALTALNKGLADLPLCLIMLGCSNR